MVETTILTLATSNRASLRTTVPMSIVKQFNLKSGDKLEWAFEVRNNEIIVVVKPVRQGKDSTDIEK
jgi:antitoxin component of MazEF toxin-antitoxin module